MGAIARAPLYDRAGTIVLVRACVLLGLRHESGRGTLLGMRTTPLAKPSKRKAGRPPPRPPVVIGKRLEELRDRYQWSAVQMAAQIGTSAFAVREYERERREMGTVTLMRYIDAFHLASADYLLGLKPTPAFRTRDPK